MKVVITPRAIAQMQSQLAYGVERHGLQAAEGTFKRVDSFITRILANHPFAGRLVAPGLRECPIPRTPFIVFFRVEEAADILRIVGFFHASQDRSQFDPDDV